MLVGGGKCAGGGHGPFCQVVSMVESEFFSFSVSS